MIETEEIVYVPTRKSVIKARKVTKREPSTTCETVFYDEHGNRLRVFDGHAFLIQKDAIAFVRENLGALI